MAIPKLINTITNVDLGIDRLKRYRNDSKTLEVKFQYFIAEIIMLRMFSILEDAIAEIAFKIASGAEYTNGSTPVLLFRAKSIAGARTAMLSFGRTKPIQSLKWTKSKYIRDSVSNVIDVSEKYIYYCSIYGAQIDEMRKVRNFLAHRSQTSRSDYKQVVRIAYGANAKISPGVFLISDRRSAPRIDTYLSTIPIIIKDLAKGY